MSGSSSELPPPPPPPPPMSTSSTSSPLPGAAVVVNRKGQPKKFHRILWDSDAATRDGKTSIGVLLEWLAAPGNYERWRDGKSQFGETREALCSQIKAEMARHGILHRENANIRTQLSELERSFDNAVAWLTQSGFGSRLPAASAIGAQEAEAHVLRLCRYFHVLEPVMGAAAHMRGRRSRPTGTGRASKQAPSVSDDSDDHHRRSATEPEKPPEPISTSTCVRETASTTAMASEEDTMLDSHEVPAEASAMTALAERAVHERQQSPVLPQKRKAPSSPSSVSSRALTDGTVSSDSSSASAQSRMASSPAPSRILRTETAASLPPPTSSTSATTAPPALVAAADRGTQEPTSRAQAALSPPNASVAGQEAGSDPADYEHAQRAAFAAAREERDRKRFHMDEERNRLECEKLRYEIQVAKLRLQVERALARKKLEKADLSPAEVVAAVEL